jgi:iron complex outermembrane receptor protein
MFNIRIAAVALLLSWQAHAQNIIQGVVKNAGGQALAGATIELVRNNRVAVTGADGRFEFAGVKSGVYEAEVRYVGYQTRRMSLSADEDVVVVLEESTIVTDEVLVLATRASENSPTTFTNISKSLIQKQNFGQDLPIVLNWSPSMVTTSDAGAGVGYTGMRIRGSDATRINVTINGIPLNDSESQNVFWVNTPDLASSTNSIQVQRGVGTSTNGAAAFGASVNLQTNVRNDSAYADVINSVGSFNTWRHTVAFGSGLINNRFAFDGRLSQITSDGFIDRASSDLKSYYLAGGYYGRKTMVKAITFGGREITYQSWWGVPESRLKSDVDAMLETASVEGWNAEQTQNLLTSNARTFNIYTYDNQVDNYRQDHYQLHTSHLFSDALTANVALHYTRGRGFYEEFRYDDEYVNYGLDTLQIGSERFGSTDLVRRRWLDNHFYGLTWSVNYEKQRLQSTLGGGWNRYDGDHFGEIIWSALPMGVPKDYRYYFNTGEKTDFNVFWKNTYAVDDRWQLFADLQYRGIRYATAGRENRQFDFDIAADFQFFNPKAGVTFSPSARDQFYASYAVANREPVRDDFVDGSTTRAPQHETLHNVEAGWRLRTRALTLNVNYYLMQYRNQLVLTGAINDVGANIRTNVPESYRTGVEVDGSVQLTKKIQWTANLTLSQNKIREFTEVLYDYGVAFDEFNEIRNTYRNTDISFSPNVIAGSVVAFTPTRGIELAWLSKYVGRQFLDNTGNPDRQIDAYWVNDLRATWQFRPKAMRGVSLSLLANNIFDHEYESNGYTYGFFGGTANEFRQNYFYPQAGRNFMVMLALRF